jgi:hypothetical protein
MENPFYNTSTPDLHHAHPVPRRRPVAKLPAIPIRIHIRANSHATLRAASWIGAKTARTCGNEAIANQRNRDAEHPNG